LIPASGRRVNRLKIKCKFKREEIPEGISQLNNLIKFLLLFIINIAII
jgi:hypothetical protein